jgi:hypothetical protein
MSRLSAPMALRSRPRREVSGPARRGCLLVAARVALASMAHAGNDVVDPSSSTTILPHRSAEPVERRCDVGVLVCVDAHVHANRDIRCVIAVIAIPFVPVGGRHARPVPDRPMTRLLARAVLRSRSTDWWCRWRSATATTDRTRGHPQARRRSPGSDPASGAPPCVLIGVLRHRSAAAGSVSDDSCNVHSALGGLVGRCRLESPSPAALCCGARCRAAEREGGAMGTNVNAARVIYESFADGDIAGSWRPWTTVSSGSIPRRFLRHAGRTASVG